MYFLGFTPFYEIPDRHYNFPENSIPYIISHSKAVPIVEDKYRKTYGLCITCGNHKAYKGSSCIKSIIFNN